MSAYNSRRPPNVSQYLANLNTVPSAQELASQQHQADFGEISSAGGGDGGLDFLTNAEFFDFDSFNPNAVDFASTHPQHQDAGKNKHRASVGGPPYQYGEFSAYPPSMNGSPTTLQGPYPPQPHHPIQYPSPPSAGDKRKATAASILSAADLEEQSRLAAEEDKRRRNTAASARFRVKKKQREQALEKQAKDMSDKVTALENKVQQLEMENKWLKGLITEKTDGKSLEAMQKDAADRKAEARTDGVGTKKEIEVEAVDDAESEQSAESVKDEA